MQIDVKSFDDRSTAVLELPIVYVVYFLAIATLILMAGLHFAWRFSSASVWIGVAIPAAGIPAWLHWTSADRDRESRGADARYIAGVLLVALAGGALATSINRPDIDDAIYAPKAVFYAEHGGERLDRSIRSVAGVPASPVSLVFQYYETVQAALAYDFDLRVLDNYHIVFPAIAGFLTCLSMFLVVTVFERRRWAALFGLVLLLLTMLSLGETHRAFGNVSIARAFQGKFMFMAVGVPAWTYFSLRFMVLGRLRDWMILVASGLAFVGATTTAMVFVPLLAGLLLISFLLDGRPSAPGRALSLAARYLSSVVPVILLALAFRAEAKAQAAFLSLADGSFPGSFEGQLRFLVNPDYPLTPIVFVLALVTVLVVSEYRRFFAIWVLAAFVMLLNPLVCGFVMKYVTTQNIYWRLFYILPFPLLVPIACLSALRKPAAIVIGGPLVFLSLAWLAFLGPTSVIRAENGAAIGRPAYKMPGPAREAVREIARDLPGGSMFAPPEIAHNLVIYTSSFPQFHLREDHLLQVLRTIGRDDGFRLRAKAFRVLYEGERGGEGFAALNELVAVEPPDYFVLDAGREGSAEVEAALMGLHYGRVATIGNRYSVYSRAKLARVALPDGGPGNGR